MSFDLDDIAQENRFIWLAKMKKKDSRHARLFCAQCTRYMGAAQTCTCTPTPERGEHAEGPSDRFGDGSEPAAVV